MATAEAWAAAATAAASLGLSVEQLLVISFGLGLLLAVAIAAYLTRKPVFLEGTSTYHSCELIEKESLSHDVRRFRFKLPSPGHILGLPIGKHIFVRAKVNDETVIRSYTPVTDVDTEGYFDLVLKIYFPDPPKFPDGGIMSQHLNSLMIGDTADFCGPTGHIRYLDNGVFAIERKRRVDGKTSVELAHRPPAKNIGMIAGGTGITPMLQILRHILHKEKGSNIQIWLLFANKTENDILLQKELEAVPGLNLWYTLDNPPVGWKYGEGFITKEMLEEHMPPPSAQTQILMCGPPPMLKYACVPNLEKLGYTPDMMIKF